jgi:hypothetical protein
VFGLRGDAGNVVDDLADQMTTGSQELAPRR